MQYTTAMSQHVHDGRPRICRNATEATAKRAYATANQQLAVTQSISAMALKVLSFIRQNCLLQISILRDAAKWMNQERAKNAAKQT
jgi:hypothetical protein